MNSHQLIESSMQSIFLDKTYANYYGEAFPRLFYEKSKLTISLDQHCEIFQRLFLLFVQVEIYQSILKLRSWALAFTLHKAFKKINRGMELISLHHDFWRKLFLTLYFTNWTNLIARLSILLEIIGNMCLAIIYCPVCHVITFEINLSLHKYHFLYNQKVRTKKGFHLPKTVSDLREV